jgi:hypothetical protein
VEGKTKDVHDNYIYQSYFEEELDYVVQMEDIFEGSFKNHGETYFNILDCNFKFEGHKKFIKNCIKVM